MKRTYDQSADRAKVADKAERDMARRRAMLAVYCAPKLLLPWLPLVVAVGGGLMYFLLRDMEEKSSKAGKK